MSSEAIPLTQTDRTHPSTGETNPAKSGKNSLKRKEYDEYAWFALFLLAASYFVITRRGGGIHHSRGGLLSSFSQPYQISASSVSVMENSSEEALRSIFYIAKHQKIDSTRSLQLAHNHQLEVVLSSPPDLYCTEETADKKCNTDDNQEECKKQSSNEQSIPFLSHLISTTWVHDEDLGRGFLLLADGGRSGRIWRWEVGGGPITIGRSLHMERSGCRSGLWVDGEDNTKMRNGTCPDNIFSGSVSSCSKAALEQRTSSSPPLFGSASLVVELTRDAERSSIGKNIVVAEWGERRIVRVEGETGARTPLVVLVPPPKHHDTVEVEDEGQEAAHESEEMSVSKWVRVRRPNHLTYTPFGDLLFSDNHDNVGIVYRLKEAVHVQPISAEQSRDAHGWERSTMEDQANQNNIDILFQTDALIEGLALGSDYSMLYILVASPIGKTVYRVSLDSDDDEDSVSGDAPSDEPNEGERVGASVFYSMSYGDCEEDQLIYNDHASSSVGSKLSVDAQGTLYMITCSSTVMLLSQEQGKVIGTLASLGSESFTSIGFGEDGYLYITSPNELHRVKTRIGGVTLPTNLVVPQPAKSATSA
eukprot:CAMPEP_0201725670 /NCGR_PEP_ID=MMETSP0593-20130828/9002_1 /ASSEMBLY_ACC=CAM_ASM_000672 /TAXON_ID=267983 /ORGANISM="Skeletonema japonicum, Strain CCMP2506" /LENGTH=589 /DNA_ID=CAMNT_0048217099 /DNA_START=63 /DNA_END=1832 /DNA_ORIENTATION=+